MDSVKGTEERHGSRPVVPYGGDVVVARSMAAVHVRNPWTGRCRGCREVYPCRDRMDAEVVLAGARRAESRCRRLRPWMLVLLLAAGTATIVAIVVAVAWR